MAVILTLYAAICVVILSFHCPVQSVYDNPFQLIQHKRATVETDLSISLSVSPTTLDKSGSWITASWEGVSKPAEDDWIGVYSPPVNNSIDPKNHAPIKYQFATKSPSHMKDGTGSLHFRLVNMREDIILGFFTGGFDKPTLTAVSGIVKFNNPNEPLQGHLALTGDPTEMTLMWVTKNSSKPEVMWGTSQGVYTQKLQAKSSTYTDKDMCGKPATEFGYRDVGTLHQTTMNGLKPGAVYYYKFGDDQYGWSEEYMFKAAPPVGPNGTVYVVTYGDMGTGQYDGSNQAKEEQQPSLNTTRLVTKQLKQTDMVLHVGDISYAEGYASVWEDFFDLVQPVATRVPYMVCIGNHERDYPHSNSYYDGKDSGGECGVPHERRFPMPRPSLDEAWYGFDFGPVHFLLMSTEHDFREKSDQYNYLKSHLKAIDRKKTPWLVFGGHRPMYVAEKSLYPFDEDVVIGDKLRSSLEPLFKKYDVDVALWGHHHSYQRTCPMYDNECADGGTTHFVIGNGGQHLSKPYSSKPNWLEAADNDHWGYSRFTVNSTVLHFEYLRDTDGMVHDEVFLKK